MMAIGWFAILLLLIVFVIPAGGLVYRRYLGVTTGNALLLAALCIVITVIIFSVNSSIVNRQEMWGKLLQESIDESKISGVPHYRYLKNQIVTIVIFRSVLPLFLVPFVVNLYRKWVGNHVTGEEKLPSMDGIRAWLCAGNLICAAGISICVWKGFSPGQLSTLFLMLLLTVGSLFIYPLLNMLSHIVELRMNPREDLSAAREKILQLLEQGKITPEESAELLSALKDKPKESGSAQPGTPPPAPDES